MTDHMYDRWKAYLRARGEMDHYKMIADIDESVNWRINTWNYENIPQPEVSDVPMLTQDEYFHEYEDLSSYTNDVYIVSTDGTIRADRRQYLSGLENGKLVLEAGRYQVCSVPDLKLYINGQEVKSIIKAITPVRVSVETPTEETTLIVWTI